MIAGGSTLTIAPGVTVHGLTGTIGNYPQVAGVSLINQGTIAADTAGGQLTIELTSLSNPGTLRASGGSLVTIGSLASSGTLGADSGGVLSLNGSLSNTGTITSSGNSTVDLGGTFTLADLGTFHRTGGTVNLTGTLNNPGTLALDDTTGSWQLEGGTIAGGTVTTAGAAELVGTPSGGTLDEVTLAGTLDVGNWRRDRDRTT